MEEIFGTIKTVQEKQQLIQIKNQEKQERIKREEDDLKRNKETKLIEYLKKWFNSDEERTHEFNCASYSPTFLLKLQSFVEHHGYHYNSHIYKNLKVTSFIISCGVITDIEFGHSEFYEFNIHAFI